MFAGYSLGKDEVRKAIMYLQKFCVFFFLKRVLPLDVLRQRFEAVTLYSNDHKQK